MASREASEGKEGKACLLRYRGETRPGKLLRGKERKQAGCDIGVGRDPGGF